MLASSGSGRKITLHRGRYWRRYRGPVAIGGAGSDVFISKRYHCKGRQPLCSAEHKEVAIGAAGERVTLPHGWRREGDICKRENPVLRIFFIPSD